MIEEVMLDVDVGSIESDLESQSQDAWGYS